MIHRSHVPRDNEIKIVYARFEERSAGMERKGVERIKPAMLNRRTEETYNLRQYTSGEAIEIVVIHHRIICKSNIYGVYIPSHCTHI